MPNRAFALKFGTVLCAALLAAAGGYAGAQTAPKALPVVTTVPTAPPTPTVGLPTPQPAVPVASRQAAVQVTTSTATTARPTVSQSAPVTAQTRTVIITATPTGATIALQPTPAPDGVVAAAPTSVPTVAVSGHGVIGTVVRRQGQYFIVRPASGPDVRVMVDGETLIRSQSGGGTRLPQPGDQTVAVGAPRPDGALAARAMLISPPAPPAHNASPRRR